MSDPIRVVVVDDQELVRTGFSMILDVEDDIEVVGSASDGAEALDRCAARCSSVVLPMPAGPSMTATPPTNFARRSCNFSRS